MYGIQVVQDPRPTTVRSAAVLSNLAPITAWGWAWIAGSSVAIACALIGGRRPAVLWIGFACAMYPPALWGIAFASAYLFGTYPGAWTGAATWGGAALRLLIVATWRDDTPARPEAEAMDE
ncbi:hypothetical protein [Streptomyces bauhiniae]|uniref:Uncharacterized protein n=1 Tax=Streptomyces bauhiniae TaxID=2340725 RepID=A0A7K3QRK5_9ACTN|nr:hypothetical protein [Streptomyces bauhiniae]NEB92463.1 hypothetical protein [Streptomyces bauhiniae]